MMAHNFWYPQPQDRVLAHVLARDMLRLDAAEGVARHAVARHPDPFLLVARGGRGLAARPHLRLALATPRSFTPRGVLTACARPAPCIRVLPT